MTDTWAVSRFYNYEYSCYEVLSQVFLWTYVFILDIYLGLELLAYKVYFHKNVPNHFPEWMYHSTLPWMM